MTSVREDADRQGLTRLHTAVRAAIDQLAPTERAAVIAVYFYGQTQTQIARQLQLTSAVVGTMIWRALRQVATALETDAKNPGTSRPSARALTPPGGGGER